MFTDMTYKQVLDLCSKNNINKYDILIADTVETIFIEEGGRYYHNFEQLCKLTADVYSEVDRYIPLIAVVKSLYQLVIKDRCDLNSIDQHEIIGNVKN